jgi:hypothetical protein
MAASPSRSHEIWSADATIIDAVEIGFFTDYKCTNGNSDAMIALDVEALYIANESDTSLPSNEPMGKSGALVVGRATLPAIMQQLRVRFWRPERAASEKFPVGVSRLAPTG